MKGWAKNSATLLTEDMTGAVFVTYLIPSIVTSAITIASAPIDNLIDEFLPDVAKHVSFHSVLIQRIVNHLTPTDGTS